MAEKYVRHPKTDRRVKVIPGLEKMLRYVAERGFDPTAKRGTPRGVPSLKYPEISGSRLEPRNMTMQQAYDEFVSYPARMKQFIGEEVGLASGDVMSGFEESAERMKEFWGIPPYGEPIQPEQEAAETGLVVPSDIPPEYMRRSDRMEVSDVSQEELLGNGGIKIESGSSQSPEDVRAEMEGTEKPLTSPDEEGVADWRRDLGMGLLGLGGQQMAEGAQSLSGLESLGGLATAMGGIAQMTKGSNFGIAVSTIGTLMNMAGKRRSRDIAKQQQRDWSNRIAEAITAVESV